MLALPLKPTPVADAYAKPGAPGPDEVFPLDLALCRGCGALQLLDAVDPRTLFSKYVYTTTTSLGLVEHFRGQVESVLAKVKPGPDALAVDIGSNDGSLLKLWKEKGLRVLGVDPAEDIARRATEAGVKTVPAFFTLELARRLAKESGKAAVVSANNVFAHSDALAEMADGVRELLREDGVFVFEVSYLPDILDRMLFDTVYHEHLLYHAVAPLRAFFEKHGLHLFDVERMNSKGGSLRGFVRIRGNPSESPVVAELADSERRRKLFDPETYQAFGRRIDEAKKAVHAMMDPKLRWAGYGASATVTTLLHHFELGPKLDCLYDDNPGKHGTLSPGYRLPVKPSEKIYEEKPDAIVILAWQYAAPIAKRHERFLKEGGKMLVPLPEPRWL